jgi:hypothetical protein
VVVEGFQKFQAGDMVDPVTWQTTRSAAEDPAGHPAEEAHPAEPTPVRYSNAR